MPRPPVGSYNPDLDAAERAAGRGVTQLQQDTALGLRRAGEDYGFSRDDLNLGLTRGEQDYTTNTQALARSFNILAGRQQEGANAAGVLRGGAMLQAAAKRKENQGIQQAGLDTGINRLREDTRTGLGRLDVNYNRQVTDFGTAQTRAQDENRFYGGDIAAQRYWQASQPGSGWTPPKPKKRGADGEEATANRNKNRRQSRWMSDAALQALVRFGPEESGLRAAERVALGTYGSTVAGAEATRKGITKSIAYARPKVTKSYDEAGLQFARARDVAAPAVAAGPASTQAAVAAEQAAFTSRLGEQEANTLTEFDQRRVDAVAGAAYAKRGARETLASDLAKLFERKQDIAREKGAFTVATAGQLRRAAQQRADTLANQEAGRAQSERNSLRSSGDRPGHGQADPGRAAGPEGEAGQEGPDSRRRTKHLRVAADDRGDRRTPRRSTWARCRGSTIVGKLKKGRTQQTSLVDKNGDPRRGCGRRAAGGAQKVTLPAMPTSAKADLRMSAALDIALDGHLSRDDAAAAAQAGLLDPATSGCRPTGSGSASSGRGRAERPSRRRGPSCGPFG